MNGCTQVGELPVVGVQARWSVRRGVLSLLMMVLMCVAEVQAGPFDESRSRIVQVQKIYDAGNRDSRVVSHDSGRVFMDFSISHWSGRFDWVAVAVNGGPQGARVSLSGLRHNGDNFELLPLNVTGLCGDVEAVLWAGGRDRSPINSAPFRFSVDCRPPRITLRGFSTGVVGGGSLVSPRELRAGECSDGSVHRFDIHVSDDYPISLVTTTLDGEALRAGSGRVVNYDSTSMPEHRSLSIERIADTPGSVRPNLDSFLTIEVTVRESSGRLTQQRLRLLVSGTSAGATRISQPGPRSMIPATSSWRIAGQVHSYGCAHKPDRVQLWHAIPGGTPRKEESVPVGRNGQFVFNMRPRTIPVGNNVFNVDIPRDDVRDGLVLSGMSQAGQRSRVEVQITPLTQDTLNKVQTPTVRGLPDRSPRPGSLSPDIVPLVNTTGPAAEKVEKSAPSGSVQPIQKKGLSDKAIRGIHP